MSPAATALSLVSCAVYATVDLAGRRLTSHRLPVSTAMGTAAISYAFNRNLGAWVGSLALRLRPRVCGTDGSGRVTRDNPQTTPERDDFRLRCQSAKGLGHLQRPNHARRVSRVAFGVPWGRKKGV